MHWQDAGPRSELWNSLGCSRCPKHPKRSRLPRHRPPPLLRYRQFSKSPSRDRDFQSYDKGYTGAASQLQHPLHVICRAICREVISLSYFAFSAGCAGPGFPGAGGKTIRGLLRSNSIASPRPTSTTPGLRSAAALAISPVCAGGCGAMGRSVI